MNFWFGFSIAFNIMQALIFWVCAFMTFCSIKAKEENKVIDDALEQVRKEKVNEQLGKRQR